MNLLYSLHFNKVAACPLNCYMSKSKEKEVKKIAHIPKSEKLVIMISCGKPKNDLKSAFSERYDLESILTVK